MDTNDLLRGYWDGSSLESDEQLETLIGQIQSSDEPTDISDGAARRVLNDFCLRQSFGHPHNPVALNWLADVLSEILDQKEPRTAIGLVSRPANRPPGASAQIETRKLHVAMWVRVATHRGYAVTDAKERAAQIFGTGVRNIERYMSEFQSLPDEEVCVELLKKIGKPAPPTKPPTGK